MNPFFDEIGVLFVDEAKKRGVTIQTPKLDSKASSALLDLAKVVSHSRERMFAPLACYLAGIAGANAQAQQPNFDIAEYVKEIRNALEPKP